MAGSTDPYQLPIEQMIKKAQRSMISDGLIAVVLLRQHMTVYPGFSHDPELRYIDLVGACRQAGLTPHWVNIPDPTRQSHFIEVTILSRVETLNAEQMDELNRTGKVLPLNS